MPTEPSGEPPQQLFAGLTVCTTGLPLHVKEQVRKIVRSCGGTFADDLALASTTHLIADAAGSHKHRAALAHDIPVATSRWVFDSFRANALQATNQYTLRTLQGLVLCTTGLSQQVRTQVESLASHHGAQYDAHLEVGHTTHLITAMMESSLSRTRQQSAKQDAAEMHDIPVVDLAWLHACVERGHLVDESEYGPEAMHTKVQTAIAAKKMQPRLSQLLQRQLDTLVAAGGTGLRKHVTRYWQQQRTHTQEVMEDAEGEKEEEDEGGEEEWMPLLDGCGFCLVGFPPATFQALRTVIRVGMGSLYDDLQIPAVSHVLVSSMISTRLRHGSTSSRADSDDGQWRLTRMQQAVAAANAEAMVHFVSPKWLLDSVACLRLEPEEMYPVEMDEPEPAIDSTHAIGRGGSFHTASIVSLTHSQSSMVDEEGPEGGEGGGGGAGEEEEALGKDKEEEEVLEAGQDDQDHGNEGIGPNDERGVRESQTIATAATKPGLFSEYGFLLVCVDPDEPVLIRPLLRAIQRHSEEEDGGGGGGGHDPSATRSTTKESSIRGAGGGQAIALDHRDFALVDPTHFEFVTHIVVCSGVALDEAMVARTLTAFQQQQSHQQNQQNQQNPQNQPNPPETSPESARSPRRRHHQEQQQQRHRYRHRVRVVSDLWVRCCLAARCVLPRHAHELFSLTSSRAPRSLFPTPLPLACFQARGGPTDGGVVASTSVYVGVDRVVVVELLKMAGARVTSTLSKRNTHLICLSPLGMKYDKARQWGGIHCVTARWVVQSVLAGRLLPEQEAEFQVGYQELQLQEDPEKEAGKDESVAGPMHGGMA